MTRLIAITGQAGSGKTTAAGFFERHGFVRTRFADPLKAMLRALGLGQDEVDGSRKELPCALLNGKTPRHAMQTLGTEWGRISLGEEFWIRHWQARAADCLDLGGDVVVDDCRFANEAAAVRALGGFVLRLEGRGGISGQHLSERQDFPADATILNVGSLDQLHEKLAELTLNGAEKHRRPAILNQR